MFRRQRSRKQLKKQEGEFCSKELGYIDTLLALKIYSQSHKQTSLTSWFGHNMLDLLIRLVQLVGLSGQFSLSGLFGFYCLSGLSGYSILSGQFSFSCLPGFFGQSSSSDLSGQYSLSTGEYFSREPGIFPQSQLFFPMSKFFCAPLACTFSTCQTNLQGRPPSLLNFIAFLSYNLSKIINLS